MIVSLCASHFARLVFLCNVSLGLKIAPSILSADFASLGDEIRKVEAAGADLIHFDVMDGPFVPNLSIGVPVMESVRKVTQLPLDAHLMIENPENYVGAFIHAGANSVTVHSEVCADLAAIATQIRKLGARASIAINPETPPDRVLAAAEHFDMILVMSVHPGFGGQEFIPESIEKLRSIRNALNRRGLMIDLQVDGGVKIDNIGRVAAAGATVFVSGSGIFGHHDYHTIIAAMRHEISTAQPPPSVG
jgi:ribulose-phosphate 3-epimerase